MHINYVEENEKLANTLISMLSKENVTFKAIDSIKKEERQNTINNEVLRIKIIALDWALENKVITEDELKEEEFITDNKDLTDFIANAGLGALGALGAYGAFGVVAAPSFFGLVGGGLGALGLAGGAMVAFPVVIAGAAIYGKAYYKNKKEVDELIEYFNKEKGKIQSFYLSKINKMQDEKTISHEIEKVPPIRKEKKIVKENTNNQKSTSLSKKTIKKVTKPKIKQVEKDVDYDKCVVRYDAKLKTCTIKHENNIRDKKNGLHGKAFKSFVHKIPPMIGHDIFNMSLINIVFVGNNSDFTELKKACKVFKESDNINIEISFRDITKKA